MTDPVIRIKQLFRRLDPDKHQMAYSLLTDSMAEIERLRKDKERALATLRFVARNKYDEENLRYAAECAIEEITI